MKEIRLYNLKDTAFFKTRTFSGYFLGSGYAGLGINANQQKSSETIIGYPLYF